MNRVQRYTLVVGLLLVFSAGLFPPAVDVAIVSARRVYLPTNGKAFLFTAGAENEASQTTTDIDYRRIGLEWATVAALAGGVCLMAHRRKARPVAQEAEPVVA